MLDKTYRMDTQNWTVVNFFGDQPQQTLETLDGKVERDLPGKDSNGMERICETFDTTIHLYLMGIFCILGLVGNLISYCVFSTQARRFAASVIQFKAVSVSDSLLLLITLAMYTIPTALKDYYNFAKFQTVIWPVAMAAHTLGIWQICLLTFTRYKAVHEPFTRFGSGQKRKNYIWIVLITVASVVFNIPRCFEHMEIGRSSPNMNITTQYLGDNFWYKLLYANIAYFSAMYIFPLAGLAYLNYKLITNLKVKTIRRSSTSSITSIKQQNDSITLNIIMVVFVFIICQTPALVNQVLWAVLPDEQRECGHFHYFYTHFSDLLVVANSSCNILIYSFTGSTFRKSMKRTLCRFKVKRKSTTTIKQVVTPFHKHLQEEEVLVEDQWIKTL